MKKVSLLLLSALFAISVTACGGKDKSDKSESSSQTSENSASSENTVTTSDNSSENSSSGDSSSDIDNKSEGSAAILEKVWASYGEDETFPVSGGDASVASMKGPGKYSIEDSQAVDSALGYPAAEIDKTDDAASLMHMMNANTFTCGAYHIKNENDITDLAVSIKDNIMKRQWMCGFPDKLIIIKVDSYIISAFGEEEIINTFKTKVTQTYPEATVITEEPIL